MFQLLSVHGNNDVRRTETHSAESESLVPEPGMFEVQIAIEKKMYKSPGIDQIDRLDPVGVNSMLREA